MSTTANANETATMLLHQRLVLQAGIDYTLLTPLLKKPLFQVILSWFCLVKSLITATLSSSKKRRQKASISLMIPQEKCRLYKKSRKCVC